MAVKSLGSLKPSELENFAFDILQAVGMKSLVWRTPGADGGRDIEGVYPLSDLSGYYEPQLWYVECKKYSNAINWPTVWEKIAHAQVRNAQFLLLVTNSNPSPTCETRISEWNANNRYPKVRVWRGYDLMRLATAHPHVALKYGLLDSQLYADGNTQDILFQLMKIIQAAHLSHEFGSDPSLSLEAGSSLSELISQRLNELREHGRYVPSVSGGRPNYTWIKWKGDILKINEAGQRAILTFIRFLTGAKSLECTCKKDKISVRLIEARISLSQTALSELSKVGLWCNIEINSTSPTLVKMTIRK
jgi:hypothetical protein